MLPCFAAAASPSPDPFANINAMITQAAQANNNIAGTNTAVSSGALGWLITAKLAVRCLAAGCNILKTPDFVRSCPGSAV